MSGEATFWVLTRLKVSLFKPDPLPHVTAAQLRRRTASGLALSSRDLHRRSPFRIRWQPLCLKSTNFGNDRA